MKLKQQREMMAAFDKFSARITIRYGHVRDCLTANRFEEAQILLSDIAASHARTSLSLRNLLVKHGAMEDRK